MDSVEQFVNLLKGMSDRIEQLEKEVNLLREQKEDKVDQRKSAKKIMDAIKRLGQKEYKLEDKTEENSFKVYDDTSKLWVDNGKAKMEISEDGIKLTGVKINII